STRSPIAPTTLPSSLSFKHDTSIQEREREEIFSFDSANLSEWLMEETLWNHLPEEMRKKLKTTQHAGATVLTSLKRLEQLEKNLPPEELETPAELPTELSSSSLVNANALEFVNEQLNNIELIRAERPNRPKRSNSEAIFNCSPVASRPSFTTSQAAQDSSRSEKSSDTHSTDFMSPAARLSPPSMMSPASPHEFYSPSMTPFELGEPRLPNLPTISRRDSELALTKSHSNITRRDSDLFSGMSRTTTSSSFKLKVKAPKDPKLTAYHAELEQLRQKELVRLRHSQRPVEKLWKPPSVRPVSATA
ncbi:MAG: hypothetical protein INR71_16090, partial [Terriglobus roseus]|nr:hypothetical protein [Terriglobus roseus]